MGTVVKTDFDMNITFEYRKISISVFTTRTSWNLKQMIVVVVVVVVAVEKMHYSNLKNDSVDIPTQRNSVQVHGSSQFVWTARKMVSWTYAVMNALIVTMYAP